MNCPSCGYGNEAGAPACNLCGKLLATKPAPVPAVAAAAKGETTRPVPPVLRVPSWPNRAILCLLFAPASTLVLLPFMAPQEESQDEFGDRPQTGRFLFMAVAAAVQLIATVPLAARLWFGPLMATVLSVIVLMLGMPFHLGWGSPLSWIALAGIGMAWYGRSAFTHPWESATLVDRALGGYRRLLAPDRWAPLRLIGGVVLFLGGIAFMLAAGTALSKVIPISRPVAKFLGIPAFLGGFLAASALSWSEVADPAP